MFSNNMKISVRQLYRLIVLDWIGKAVLLLPGFMEQADSDSFFASLLLGAVLTIGYAWLVGRLAGHMEEGFYEYVRERLGTGIAWLMTVVYWCYVLVNTIFLVRLFGSVAVTFLLPESSVALLMGLVLFAGAYLAAGGLEVRARVAEVLFTVVILFLLILIFGTVFGSGEEIAEVGRAKWTLQSAGQGMEIFIAFGGMGLFLFIAPNLNQKEQMGKVLCKSGTVTLGTVFVLMLALLTTFGQKGIYAMSWPVIRLMSSAKLPLVFLTRWDVVFAGLLLGSFFPAVGAGIFYLRLLAAQLFHRQWRWYPFLFAVLVWLGAFWCGSYETAERVFYIVNGCLLIPVVIIFSVFLGILEFIRYEKG